MTRLSAYLASAAVAEAKLTRIGEQIERAADELVQHRLGRYYFAEGAGEVEKKRAIAELVATVVQEHADSFGELLSTLQPSAEQLRQLYLRADATPVDDPAAAEAAAAEPRPKRGLVRLPVRTAAAAASSETRPAVGRAEVFAKTVMSAWVKQLRAVSDSAELQRHLRMEREALQAVTDELIAGSDRIRVEEKLIGALEAMEEKRSTTRVRIVDQQVFRARTVVNEFVDTLGVDSVPPADRPPSQFTGRRLFESPPPIAPGTLPTLPAEEIPYSAMVIMDWIDAFARLAVDNAGHSAGREISPEQNRRLGEILALIRGGAAG
jgi:hypothetical protein